MADEGDANDAAARLIGMQRRGCLAALSREATHFDVCAHQQSAAEASTLTLNINVEVTSGSWSSRMDRGTLLASTVAEKRVRQMLHAPCPSCLLGGCCGLALSHVERFGFDGGTR